MIKKNRRQFTAPYRSRTVDIRAPPDIEHPEQILTVRVSYLVGVCGLPIHRLGREASYHTIPCRNYSNNHCLLLARGSEFVAYNNC